MRSLLPFAGGYLVASACACLWVLMTWAIDPDRGAFGTIQFYVALSIASALAGGVVFAACAMLLRRSPSLLWSFACGLLASVCGLLLGMFLEKQLVPQGIGLLLYLGALAIASALSARFAPGRAPRHRRAGA